MKELEQKNGRKKELGEKKELGKRKELREKKEIGMMEIGNGHRRDRCLCKTYGKRNQKSTKTPYPQKVCRDPCSLSAGSENPPITFPKDRFLTQKRRNRKRADKRRLWRYFKSLHGKARPKKAQETRYTRAKKKEMKAAFKSFYTEICKPVDSLARSHKTKGHKLPYGSPQKAATLNIRGLSGPNGITKRQLIGDVMRKECLDILLLTETQVSSSSVESHDEFIFLFSSDVQPGKNDREHAGVGIVIHKRLKPFLYEVRQNNGRMMAIRLRSHGMNLAFLCCYAPHSGHSTETKESFYESLQSMLNEFNDITYLGGDFSARLHHRYSNEIKIMGPHIFGRGRSYLERVAPTTRENRDLFVDFCTANDLRVLNTDYPKTASKQVTFGENTTQIGDPFLPEKYAQLDFWLTRCKHKNQCTDVQIRSDIYLDTDHYMLELKIRMKMAARRHATMDKAPRFAKPSNDQWLDYNQSVSRLYQTLLQQHDGEHWKLFNSAVETAAAKCLSREIPHKKKDYLSPHTWNLIKSRQRSYQQCKHEEVKTLDRQIKKHARSDRKRQVVNQFQLDPSDPHRKKLWKAVNHLRKDFKPAIIY